MVTLKYENYKNKVVRHTLANAKGGRSLNIEMILGSGSFEYVVSEKKKIVVATKLLDVAIKAFNEMEAATEGKGTKSNIIPAKPEKGGK